jgi:hypothetical protein
MKECASCKHEKPLSSFGKKSNQPDGLYYYCRSCKAQKDKEYRNKAGDSLKEKKRQYYQTNKEDISRKAKEAYLTNSKPAKDRARKWVALNREKHNASCMERHVLKMSRRPEWARELTLLACQEAYDKAKRLSEMTGVPYDVDHIVPLRGETVCGLHIYNNLQVIPASQNRSKKHLYWPDQWK